jgi:hypothetical protein
MSVLTDSNQYASSSRVRAVYRYLVRAKDNSEAREQLERRLSPESLLRGGDEDSTSRAMIRGTVGECLKMKLIAPAGDDVILSPELPEEVRRPIEGDPSLPVLLARLMITTENDANANLCSILAWYLAQDAYAAPGNWLEMDEAIQRQGAAAHLTEMNNARYSQFEDWVCYLGFAWRHALGEKKVLTPDPTAYLRRSLTGLFEGSRGQAMPLGDFITKLGAACPVFETGEFRNRVEALLGPRESEAHLSSTTSLALLRLKEEGLIELSVRGDARLFVLPDGDQVQTCSHLTLN